MQLRTCLKCGHEWKSNPVASRPQCSSCGSTNNILSKDIPPNITFEKELNALKTEITDLRNIIIQLSESYEDELNRLGKFELQVTHDLKNLLFWNNVLKERTTPLKPPNPAQVINKERNLGPIRHMPLKKPRNIHNNTARPAGY